MFVESHMFAQRAAAALALAALLAMAGCGSGDGTDTVAAEAAADSGDVAVIEGWAKALASGDERAAAGYFAIPSTAENGPLLTSIDSRADAIAFNRSLPCGAEVVSAQTTGELTTATFRLSDRPGGDCGIRGRRHRLDDVRHRGREDRRVAPGRRRPRAGQRRRRGHRGLTRATAAQAASMRRTTSAQTSDVEASPPRSWVLIPSPAAPSVAS